MGSNRTEGAGSKDDDLQRESSAGGGWSSQAAVRGAQPAAGEAAVGGAHARRGQLGRRRGRKLGWRRAELAGVSARVFFSFDNAVLVFGSRERWVVRPAALYVSRGQDNSQKWITCLGLLLERCF